MDGQFGRPDLGGVFLFTLFLPVGFFFAGDDGIAKADGKDRGGVEFFLSRVEAVETFRRCAFFVVLFSEDQPFSFLVMLQGLDVIGYLERRGYFFRLALMWVIVSFWSAQPRDFAGWIS